MGSPTPPTGPGQSADCSVSSSTQSTEGAVFKIAAAWSSTSTVTKPNPPLGRAGEGLHRLWNRALFVFCHVGHHVVAPQSVDLVVV